MTRDYDRLLKQFEQRYFKKHAKGGQLYASDYHEIKNRAIKKTGEQNGDTMTLLFNCIDLSLQLGVMIGYNAGKAEAKRAKHERI